MRGEATGDPASPLLTIALQDGFTGEDVVVRVDGQQVHRSAAQTAWEISLATSFETSVSEGGHHIEIEIPARGLRDARDVDVRGPQWLGISVLDQAEVTWRESAEPFGYV